MLTAEIRWWWRSGGVASTLLWFEAGRPSSPLERTDTYLRAGVADIGMKLRGGTNDADECLEVKALVDRMTQQVPGGQVELWIKHSVAATGLPPGKRVQVRKLRRLRRFRIEDDSAAEIGQSGEAQCTLEYGTARVGRATGTTLCFEAQASLAAPLANLLPVLRLTGVPPEREEALLASYPTWLSRIARI